LVETSGLLDVGPDGVEIVLGACRGFGISGHHRGVGLGDQRGKVVAY
jgi:hypothetical protein